MTAAARRRRAALLLALALACGGLAASEVGGRVREVEARVGVPVAVVVAARELVAGEQLRPRDVRVREVPERFIAPDALTDPGDLAGLVPTVGVPRGSYLTAALFGAGGTDGDGPAGPGALRAGERAVEVAVAGSGALADSAPGARVDVLVSTEPSAGPGRTAVALEDVELLGLAAGGSEAVADVGEGASASASAVATLRVTPRQAVYLTAAHNFAREIRLLARPPGDRRAVAPPPVAADGL